MCLDHLGDQSVIASSETTTTYDLKNTISHSRLLGLWRRMTRIRLPYLVPTLSLGIATMASTAT